MAVTPAPVVMRSVSVPPEAWDMYFAAALTGLLSNSKNRDAITTNVSIAATTADLMSAERAKRNP